MCSNLRCQYCSKEGCKLFKGESWRLCRRSVELRKNSKSQTTKGK